MFHIYQKGNGNIAYTLELEKSFRLEEVRLHLSAAVAQTFTVTINSAQGSEYNAVLNSQDMTSATDEIFIPTRPEDIAAGDKLAFALTNTAEAWGLEIIYRGSDYTGA